MNLFFVVEGQTEAKVYRAWLAHLVPHLKEVEDPHEVTENNYYLIYAGGQSAIKKLIADSIAEINQVGRYNYLIICLDAEESLVKSKKSEVYKHLVDCSTKGISLQNAKFKLIIQNRCLETWFLGNRDMYPPNPYHSTLVDYLNNHYNASINDPEKMPKHPNFTTHADFHKNYFWLLVKEKKKHQRKGDLGPAVEPTYLNALQARIKATPTHLKTFQIFLKFCQEI